VRMSAIAGLASALQANSLVTIREAVTRRLISVRSAYEHSRR
jgi:hypothetical protein